MATTNSAPGGSRTHSPRIRNPMLYPIELRALSKTQYKWSGRRDSNPQPPAWKAGALPIELHPPASLVGERGLEPPASCSQGRRAPTCATPRPIHIRGCILAAFSLLVKTYVHYPQLYEDISTNST